jgi:hypothetical protein
MTRPNSKGKKRRAGAALFVAALTGFVLYELLFGRLFPFSPLAVGFLRQDYGNIRVYHHGQPEASQLSYLIEVAAIEEAYHGMAFRSKPHIVFCATDREYRRLSGGTARFIALNGRLFVSARAQKEARQGKIVLRTYLTHELSHCLLQQHTSIWAMLWMPKWLLEGTAMDCAAQVGVGVYPTRSAVYDAVAHGVFCEPEDFGSFLQVEKGTAISCPIENKTAFFYSEFGCLVDYFRSQHGAPRYQAFLKQVLQDHASNVDRSFETIYGIKFSDEVARFKAETKKR